MNTIKLVMLFIFIANTARSQYKVILISGQIDTTIMAQYGSNELIIRTKATMNADSEGSTLKVLLDNNGSFNTKLKSIDSLVYYSFELEDKKDESYNKGSFYNVSAPKNQRLKVAYLFQVRDSIHVDIRKEGQLLFTGFGSEKLNCQWNIYNLEPFPKSIRNSISNISRQSRLKEKLEFEDKALNLAIQLRLELLKSYKTQFSAKIYTLLYLDATASAEYAILEPLKWNLLKFPGGDNKLIVQEYFQSYLDRTCNLNIDSGYLFESGYYADMLFEREYNLFKLYSPTGSYLRGDSFVAIFDNIKSKYSGKLRDKLIFILYEKLAQNYYYSEAISIIDDVLKIMHDGTYKSFVKYWNDKQARAFPFELYDTNDNKHKLSDYQGKVIIFDYWFTGCVNCLELSKAMYPIIEKYKNNKNVVFISLSTDSKLQWLKSLATGKYTSSGMVNLYTKGLGTSHPMIRYYNWLGAPQQLIIGKQGNLITSSPPRADGGLKNTSSFMKIIDDNLLVETTQNR